MEIGPKSILKFFPAADGIFGEAFQPVLSWSLQFEAKIFDGMEVIPTSHVYMQDKILDLDPWVGRFVVCLYIHRFKTLWKFMVQYFFGEAQGVSSPSISGRVVACRQLLLCPVLIPNWYLVGMVVLVTIVPRRGVSFRSVYGPGRAGFLIQVLT